MELTLLSLALTRPFKMSLIRAGLLIALVAIALQHSRHQMLLGILAPMLLASPIAKAIGAGSAGEEWRRLARIALPATVRAVMASGVFRLMMPIEQTDGATAPISALSAVPPELRRKPVLYIMSLAAFSSLSMCVRSSTPAWSSMAMAC